MEDQSTEINLHQSTLNPRDRLILSVKEINIISAVTVMTVRGRKKNKGAAPDFVR